MAATPALLSTSRTRGARNTISVWDKILGLNIFPETVAQNEIAYYKSVMQPYGVPLDSRTHLTKTDWSLWIATLANNPGDFEHLVSPIYDYLNQTTARIPLADSYVTDNIGSDGMHARPVVGGIYIKMLADRAMWKKWSGGDKMKVTKWAPLPIPPQVTMLVPTSEKKAQTWYYTTQKPADDWTSANFDASAWKEGPGGFGTAGTPGAIIGTAWNTDDIWLRREVMLPLGVGPDSRFSVYHDEDVEIYVNGLLAAQESGYNGFYGTLENRGCSEIPDETRRKNHACRTLPSNGGRAGRRCRHRKREGEIGPQAKIPADAGRAFAGTILQRKVSRLPGKS